MASPEVIDSSGTMDSGFNDDLSAPQGWTKKLMPKKAGTPKRKDVIYIAPDGEEIKNKKQLDKYLKVHPGGPSSADFDWSTGETPRRSARLSSKGRLSSDSTDTEPVTKRSRRSLEETKEVRSPGTSTTPSRKGRKSQPLVDTAGKDEVMQEAEKDQDEGATEGATAPSGDTEDEKPTDEGKKVDEDGIDDEAKATVTGNDVKEANPASEVQSASEPADQLGSSEEPDSAAVKERRRRDNLQSNGRQKDEKQNKGSSKSTPGEGFDLSMRAREPWNATDSSHVLAVKTALHLSAMPETVLCRESEQTCVIDFCKTCIVEQRAGSLYICGCPGTGKSLIMEKIRFLCNTWSAQAGILAPEIVAINCTTLTDPGQIYLKVLQALDATLDTGETPSGVSKLKELRKLVCDTSKTKSSKKMMLLIVDEMDYLITRDQSVLYDLFRLPSSANSRCILIGIANAIDLTDRLLPKLRSLNCKVDVITFPAYTKDQILEVLHQRLKDLPYLVFNEAALELCARKVAAATGDMRKALHVCRNAIDIIESEAHEDTDEVVSILVGEEERRHNAPDSIETKRKMREKYFGLVGLDTMALALSRIFRSPVVETIQALPRHQQMVLCAAVNRFRRAKKDATLGELNLAYVEFCKSMGMQTLTAPEFSSICQVLADQALLNLGTNKEDRLRRVTLKPDQDDVISALQGIRFFSNCLP
ncbi:hypothetical protein Mapa_004356 [Marchantia paleacea]|nr:hypothetical protein Mapa_004356 [Marchantia paleacea]